MSLMEQFANPDAIHALSMGEKLVGALVTTLMGMGITFLILILLWGCIAIMTRVMGVGKKKTAEVPAAAAAPAAATAEAPAATEPAAAASDDSLIAVITAAVTAYEEEAAATNLVVKKIQRISGASTVWASAGRNECIDSRRV